MNETETVVTTGAEEKTYSQAEVDALIQSEADRRVSQALKTQERKHNDQMKEAQKLAQMNDAEKYQYELDKREKAIAEKERELTLAENRNTASQILAEKGIAISLVDFVVADDADTMKLNIDTLEKAFRASVKAEVEKRLGSNTPKRNMTLEEGMTREKFNALSVIE